MTKAVHSFGPHCRAVLARALGSNPLRAISRPAIAAAVIAGLSGASAWAAETAEIPKVVLELFTSQGCSSCPPADKLLGDYAKRPDILALSFNIDYWDYLGWKDTLASRDYSERQRAYAAARRAGPVSVFVDGLAARFGMMPKNALASSVVFVSR